MLKVEMLSTGDEVLHGQIVDTNAAWLADFFFHQGLPLSRRNTVGDNLDDLVTILRERSQHADVLIVNGGLRQQKVKAWCCMKPGSKRWNAISTNVDE